MGNENSGDVENLVQAGSINQVHLHYHPAESLRAEQLPPAPAGFVDREAEQASLTAALDGDRSAEQALCVLISGGSGSGKSALAMRWVHGVRGRFDGGQLYLDLRGRTVELAEAVRHCLHGLRVPEERVPGSLEAALGLYRSMTSQQRVVLVFDNVLQPRKLLPLLPASSDGLMVLIGQRQARDLVVDGVVPLELRRLDAEAGLELLRTAGAERIDAEPEQAERLVELCDGLPIALRIIAGRLARRPRWKLARVVAELEDDQRRLDRFTEDGVPVVRDALDRAVAELPERQQVLYRMLGHIPGPTFAADAVAALADLPADEAEDLLCELHEANLLECNDQDEFRFHDLVRLHAERMRTGDPEPLRRLADWYRVQGAHADRAVMEPKRFRVGQDDELVSEVNPFDHDSALHWLERERVNLLAVVAAAHEHQWNRVVISLCDGPLWALHNQHKHYADTVNAFTAAVEAAEREGDLVAEARMRTLLVRLRMELHDFAGAHGQAARAREVAERSGHRRVLGSALEFHGRVHLEQEAWSAAIPLFEQAREINAELGQPRGMALQEYFLGRALAGRGEPAEALRYLDAALQRLREFPKDYRIPGRIRVAMGRAHQRLDRHDEAVRALRAAETGIRERGVSFDLAEPLELLAESLVHLGDTAAARECAAQALEILEQARSPRAQHVRERLDALLGD